jgi:hypothetical protein
LNFDTQPPTWEHGELSKLLNAYPTHFLILIKKKDKWEKNDCEVVSTLTGIVAQGEIKKREGRGVMWQMDGGGDDIGVRWGKRGDCSCVEVC